MPIKSTRSTYALIRNLLLVRARRTAACDHLYFGRDKCKSWLKFSYFVHYRHQVSQNSFLQPLVLTAHITELSPACLPGRTYCSLGVASLLSLTIKIFYLFLLVPCVSIKKDSTSGFWAATSGLHDKFI